MKKLNWYFLVALSFAVSATAAPVQYHLTATHFAEVDWITDTQPVLASSNFLFSNGAALSATFFYDADTPLTSTISSDGVNYGDARYYMGSVTQFSAQASGYAFSSDRADTFIYDWLLVGDSDGNEFHAPNYIFTIAGDSRFPINPTNVQGFSLGDYTLINYVLGTTRELDPVHPLSAIPDFTQVQLNFENSNGARRTVAFFTNEITPVPLPAGLWLFASGLVGLGVNSIKKSKK